MSEAISKERSPLGRATLAPFSPGRALFSLAIIGLGIETLVCARIIAHSQGARYSFIPTLPWLPPIPWVACIFGVIWIVCGAGLLSRGTLRLAAITLGSLLVLCAVILDVPRNAAHLSDVGLRTIVFEPLAIASLAWLLPGRGAIPGWLAGVGRYLLALSLIVFGVDHFLVLAFIATLLPAWIPWHLFWSAFFGVAFIAAGISIGINFLERWGVAGMALMFGIWVVTLHLPRVLGLYGIAGAPRDPNEWSSLFIAVALWGGFWALAGPDVP